MTPDDSETHVILRTGEVSTLEGMSIAGSFDIQYQHSSPDIQSQYVSGAGLLGCSLSAWHSAQDWLRGAIPTGLRGMLSSSVAHQGFYFPQKVHIPF